MKFNNAQEMLNAIVNDGMDLYNPNTNEYVFLYNDCGSIAVYDWIDKEKANEIYELSIDENGHQEEYWGAFLGIGGYIFDSERYKRENPKKYDDMLNDALAWCEEHWKLDGWIDTKNYKRNVIYGAYAEQHDITFIMKDIVNYNNNIESTEVIGFVHGNEVNNTIALEKYSGKLKAEYTL